MRQEWKKTKLGDICFIRRGSSPRPIKNYLIKEGGMPWVKIGDATEANGKYINSTAEQIKMEGVTKSVIVNPGDLILSNSGTAGLPMFMGITACIHDGWQTFRDLKGIDKEYLYYFLLYIRHILLHNAYDSVMKNLTLDMLRDYELLLPPLKEQKRIVDILKTIDDKIETNNQINNNLEQQVQLLFSQDFGQYTFATNDSEESDLPGSWKYYKMVDLCKHIKPGTNFQPKRVETGIPFLNVRCVNQGYIDTSDAKFITEAEYTRVHKTWQPEENDLLISRIGTLGLVAAIRKEDLPIAVHYNFINIKTSKLPFEFMYFLLKSKQFQTAYHFIKKQSVQEYVTIDEVEDIRIPLPDINTIDFSLYKDMYAMIVSNQRENKALIHLRDELLPRLMSGELEV